MRLFASIPSARINALSSSSVSDFFQLEAVNLSAAFQENRNKSEIDVRSWYELQMMTFCLKTMFHFFFSLVFSDKKMRV